MNQAPTILKKVACSLFMLSERSMEWHFGKRPLAISLLDLLGDFYSIEMDLNGF